MMRTVIQLWLRIIAEKLRPYITTKYLQSVARFALAFVGGAIVSYAIAIGKLDVETAKVILKWVVETSGIDVPVTLVTILGPLVWADRRNKNEEKRVDGALELPAGSSRDELATHLASKKGSTS